MATPHFSTAWKASRRPSKQRKYRYNAPAHLRQHFLSCHLSKALRTQYHRRAFPAKTGDKVKILRGSFAGKTGSIDHTDAKKCKVYVTGVDRTKRDGSKVLLSIHPSNVLIEDLDLKDRERMNSLKVQQEPLPSKPPTPSKAAHPEPASQAPRKK